MWMFCMNRVHCVSLHARPLCAVPPPSLSHRHVTFKWGRRWASPPVKCVSKMTWCGSRVVSGGPVLVKRKTSPSACWPSSALLGPGCFSSVTHSTGPVTPKTHGVHLSLHGKPEEWMFRLRHSHSFAGALKLDDLLYRLKQIAIFQVFRIHWEN